MRYVIAGVLTIANVILNVRAYAGKKAFFCWSESLGYPCCSPTTTVVYNDENGMWGMENNMWCGISDNVVWAGKKKFYPLCNTCVVSYIDSDGGWGIENDQWCGIDIRCHKILKNEEWTGKSQGFPVCSGCLSDYEEILVNEEGRWAIENNQRCGIRNDCAVEREVINCEWNMDDYRKCNGIIYQYFSK